MRSPQSARLASHNTNHSALTITVSACRTASSDSPGELPRRSPDRSDRGRVRFAPEVHEAGSGVQFIDPNRSKSPQPLMSCATASFTAQLSSFDFQTPLQRERRACADVSLFVPWSTDSRTGFTHRRSWSQRRLMTRIRHRPEPPLPPDPGPDPPIDYPLGPPSGPAGPGN